MLCGNPNPNIGAMPTPHHSGHRAWFAHPVAPHCQWGVWLHPASGPLTAGLREAGRVEGPQITRASGPPASAQALHPHGPIGGWGHPAPPGETAAQRREHGQTRPGRGWARARAYPAPRAPRPASPPAAWHPEQQWVTEIAPGKQPPVSNCTAHSLFSEQIQEGPLLSLLSWLRRVSVSSSCEELGLPSRGSARLPVWSPGSTFPGVSGCCSGAPEHRLRGCGAHASVL